MDGDPVPGGPAVLWSDPLPGCLVQTPVLLHHCAYNLPYVSQGFAMPL